MINLFNPTHIVEAPFTSLSSHTSIGVSTKNSKYFPYDDINFLLYCLSSSNGAIFATTTIPPCFTISDATYPILRTFVDLSSFENPNPFDKFVRITSASNIVTSRLG